MTLLALYQDKIRENSITPDPAQEHAVLRLQHILDDLQQPRPIRQPEAASGKGFGAFFRRNKPALVPELPALKGVYLWGGVGRGKTWLMDLFFAAAPFADKRRQHFHHFMQTLHAELAGHPDQEDPLKVIAAEWAREIRLLCIDELHLTEVGNAMLLFPMLEYLIRNGVIIVSTSNRHPTELYQGEVRKERFVPAAQFLCKQMEVVQLDSGIDYRTREAEAVLGSGEGTMTIHTEQELATCFQQLARGPVREQVVLDIASRLVPALKVADNVVWMEFAVACEGARSTTDYIWLADHFEVVMLSGVHVLTEDHEPAARRLFFLVDELYDRRVQLIFATEVPLEQLYQGQRLTFAFRRALSRLRAMQVQRERSA